MLDLSYFQNQNSNVQGFFSGGTWQTWIKPRGAKLVNIICQGSGAGGGGGFQVLANTNRGGGGAGGSGATARLTINANLLPDILYILPGVGGNGGLGGTSPTGGSSGQNSFVTLIPSTGSVSNVLLRSGTTPATGGGAGSSVVGTAGAAETISLIANNIFANLGNFTFQAGVAGLSGNGGAPGNVTPLNFIVAAAGGGGQNAGGGVTATGVFPGIISAPQFTNGQNGIILYKPTLMLYGGSGGGGGAGSGAVSTPGADGGNGAPGTGGGGGGASHVLVANPSGNGGRGGDGFVIITTSL